MVTAGRQPAKQNGIGFYRKENLYQVIQSDLVMP